MVSLSRKAVLAILSTGIILLRILCTTHNPASKMLVCLALLLFPVNDSGYYGQESKHCHTTISNLPVMSNLMPVPHYCYHQQVLLSCQLGNNMSPYKIMSTSFFIFKVKI